MSGNLPATLIRLATLMDELSSELTDQVLAPGVTSQTGVRKTTINRPAPCNIKQLDMKLDIEAEVMDIIKRAAGSYLPAAKRKQGAASCCRWLASYIDVLDQCEERDQIAEDITSMELSLFRRWNREVPASMASHWLTTAQATARAARHQAALKAATLRQWAKRKKVRTRDYAGAKHYWWPDIEDQLLRLSRPAV